MQIKYLFHFLSIFLFVGLFCFRQTASAEEEMVEQQEKFIYQLEGRPDPFYPFLSKEAARKETEDEIIVEDEVLTGMRRFEPGQLTLVTVIASSGKRMAMAEDVTGRGYTLTEGMLIGRHGRIERIENGEVVVKETATTRSGRKITNTIVMRLKKEGEGNRK